MQILISYTNTGYTVVSLARYTGGRNNRVISSRSTNWLFGFHGGLVSRWHANGWISTGGPSDNDWHLHLGIIEARGVTQLHPFGRMVLKWYLDIGDLIIQILARESYSLVDIAITLSAPPVKLLKL